jgi:type IV pilus assembly protein PilA
MNLAAAAKLGVAETLSSTGTFPSSNSGAGIATDVSITGNDVQSVTVGASGVITILYSSTDGNINGLNLVLTPAANAGSVEWSCDTGTSIQEKHRPANCR